MKVANYRNDNESRQLKKEQEKGSDNSGIKWVQTITETNETKQLWDQEYPLHTKQYVNKNDSKEIIETRKEVE